MTWAQLAERVLSWAVLAHLARASNHDAVQAGAPVHTSAQRYLPKREGRALQESPFPAKPESCLDAHGAEVAHEPIRIGYELVDAEGVDEHLQEFVKSTLMARATAYWSSVLSVRRATEPLRAERQGVHCSRYPFDTEDHCTDSEPPQCGTTGFRIPEKYLKTKRTCKERCSPAFSCRGDCYLETVECACNVDDWAEQGGDYCCQIQTAGSQCPDSCNADTVTFVGSGTDGGVVCEDDCFEAPEGEGAQNEDLHVFVTIQDKEPCSPSSDLQAYASWCVKDQCDRPIFGSINFCLSKLSLDQSNVDSQVSSVVHELAHALAFSSSLFKYFRHDDGTPRIERDPSNQDVFPGQVRWSCGDGKYAFPDANGNRLYSDLSPAILHRSSERGFEECQCPIGGITTMGEGCLAGTDGFRVPSCVVRISTPRVLEEVRRHFACDTLDGAELENQDTDECAIIGSHWEQRAFNGEVMAAVGGGMAPYLSRVTLALFQDSGWYQVNFSRADALIKGVHWGYQQGCGFATDRCISDDGAPLWDRAYCTRPDEMACSMDRTRAMGCEMSTVDKAPPDVFNYLGQMRVGSLAELDYCPSFRVRLTNRVCTDPAGSTPAPYSNINIMREVFGAKSRCLMGSLRKAVQANFFQTYYFKQEDFEHPLPACYEMECAADGGSYVVKASKEPGPGSRELGTCREAGQELTVPGFEGSVMCAAPEEICQVQRAAHVSALPVAADDEATINYE